MSRITDSPDWVRLTVEVNSKFKRARNIRDMLPKLKNLFTYCPKEMEETILHDKPLTAVILEAVSHQNYQLLREIYNTWEPLINSRYLQSRPLNKDPFSL